MRRGGGRARGGRRARACALFASALLLGCAPPEPPRSVFLIVIDTLRADHLGVYGYARPTSPALDARAEEAAVFERATASSPWTLPSFASLYSGRHPSAHGAGRRTGAGPKPDFVPLPGDLPLLAERLRSAGFATAAFVENPFLHPVFGVSRGFDTYRYLFGGFQARPRSHAVVDLALHWLAARRERPFLLVLHLLAPHLPYDPPPAVRGRFTAGYTGALRLPFPAFGPVIPPEVLASEADRRFIEAAYDEELLGIDGELARVFAALDALPDRGEVLVALTSDHGEELFDHGALDHGHTLHQELLRVPLLVWGPGVRSGRIRTPVSHVDLLPTLLDALGLPAQEPLDGRSLWPLLRGGPAPADRLLVSETMLYGPERRAWLRWPWKAVETDGEAPRLYELERDPGERQDLAATHTGELAALRSEAARAAAVRAAPAAAAEIDAQTREQLEALGYGD